MSDLLDFYPLNIRSGLEFLFVYGVLSAIGVVLLSVLRNWYGARLDGQVAGGTGGSGAKLRLGQVPAPEEYYCVAYLQRGLPGVAETLIAMAHATGALLPVEGKEKTFQVQIDPTVPSHPILREFLGGLLPQTGTEVDAAAVKAQAQATARAHKTEIERELQAAGMVRTSETANRVYSAVWLGGLGVLSLGALRIVRAVSMGHPFLFLAVELVLIGVAIYVVARKSSESAARREYLSWLRDCTGSLRISVNTGWDKTPQGVGLGVALDGTSILGAAAVAGGLIYAFYPAYSAHASSLHGQQALARQQAHSDTSLGDLDFDDTGSDFSPSWGQDSSTGGSSSWTSDSGGSSSGGSSSTGDSGGGGGGSDGGGSWGGDSGGGGGGDSGGGGGGCGGGGGGCGGGGGGGGCGGGGGGCGGGGCGGGS